MLAVTVGMILIPASILVVWIGLPPIKVLMIEVIAGWGVSVGLSGFTLVLANSMPIVVPIACIAMMVAGLIGTIRGGDRSV